MPKIVKNGLEYSGTPLEEVTAWPPTGDSVQIEQPLMGNTDISEVGDGTVTGAIAQNTEDITELNNGLTPVNLSLTSNYTLTNTSFRMGKLIAISFKVAGLSGSSNIIAATIQQGYEPDIEVPLVANTNNGVYVTGWIRPGSGDIVIAPRSALSNAEARVLAVYHI